MNIDLSALKDLKTTPLGLAMICLTVLLLSGKVSMDALRGWPWEIIIGILCGGGGAALLGANSKAPPPGDDTAAIQGIIQQPLKVLGSIVEPPAG